MGGDPKRNGSDCSLAHPDRDIPYRRCSTMSISFVLYYRHQMYYNIVHHVGLRLPQISHSRTCSSGLFIQTRGVLKKELTAQLRMGFETPAHKLREVLH